MTIAKLLKDTMPVGSKWQRINHQAKNNSPIEVTVKSFHWDGITFSIDKLSISFLSWPTDLVKTVVTPSSVEISNRLGKLLTYTKL